MDFNLGAWAAAVAAVLKRGRRAPKPHGVSMASFDVHDRTLGVLMHAERVGVERARRDVFDATFGRGPLAGQTGNPFKDDPVFNPFAPGGSFQGGTAAVRTAGDRFDRAAAKEVPTAERLAAVAQRKSEDAAALAETKANAAPLLAELKKLEDAAGGQLVFTAMDQGFRLYISTNVIDAKDWFRGGRSLLPLTDGKYISSRFHISTAGIIVRGATISAYGFSPAVEGFTPAVEDSSVRRFYPSIEGSTAQTEAFVERLRAVLEVRGVVPNRPSAALDSPKGPVIGVV